MSSMNLYVGNLPYTTNENDLSDLFAQFGEVISAKVITDRYSGQSKGFGFVEMTNRDEAEQAIAQLNDSEVNGRRIKVNEAKPRAPRTDRRGGGGYGGGRGGRDY